MIGPSLLSNILEVLWDISELEGKKFYYEKPVITELNLLHPMREPASQKITSGQ
jgi:hypothetical protein